MSIEWGDMGVGAEKLFKERITKWKYSISSLLDA